MSSSTDSYRNSSEIEQGGRNRPPYASNVEVAELGDVPAVHEVRAAAGAEVPVLVDEAPAVAALGDGPARVEADERDARGQQRAFAVGQLAPTARCARPPPGASSARRASCRLLPAPCHSFSRSTRPDRSPKGRPSLSGGRLPAVPALARIRSEDAPVCLGSALTSSKPGYFPGCPGFFFAKSRCDVVISHPLPRHRRNRSPPPRRRRARGRAARRRGTPRPR